jgi:glyoxylase-like metal-dependent hydrolase (beta-lactamase superfamily II)
VTDHARLAALTAKARYTSVVILRETFPTGSFECNCTILPCGDTNNAVVIDPGGEVERIAESVTHTTSP